MMVEVGVVFVVAVRILVQVLAVVAAALQGSRELSQRRIRNRLLSSFVFYRKRGVSFASLYLLRGMGDARTLLRVAAFAASPLDLVPLVS